jgi:hypothetical protein
MSGGSDADDDAWQEWALSELRDKPSWTNYQSIIEQCVEIAWNRWRKRFSRDNWIRVMKKGRMLKVHFFAFVFFVQPV